MAIESGSVQIEMETAAAMKKFKLVIKIQQRIISKWCIFIVLKKKNGGKVREREKKNQNQNTVQLHTQDTLYHITSYHISMYLMNTTSESHSIRYADDDSE